MQSQFYVNLLSFKENYEDNTYTTVIGKVESTRRTKQIWYTLLTSHACACVCVYLIYTLPDKLIDQNYYES